MDNIGSSPRHFSTSDTGAINHDISTGSRPSTPGELGRQGARIFAYIVCVNEYKRSKWNLTGCVNDGDKIAGFLREKLFVPPEQITRLTNGDATHDGIMSLLRTVSSTANTSIREGDTIVFFYAGHGGRTKSPPKWKTDDGLIEMILPHDVDTTRPDSTQVYGIPDFVLLGALGGLATPQRGVNVLMIFDSCYSGGMARDINGTVLIPRARDDVGHIPKDTLEKLLSTYRQPPIQHYTVLAACDIRENAYEIEHGGGGRFTAALVDTLDRLLSPESKVSYATLYKCLPTLRHQTPKFIGATRRFLFSLSEAPDEGIFFDIEEEEHPRYIVLGAGNALGIEPDAEFRILSESRDVGSLVVEPEGVEMFKCHTRAQFRGDYCGPIPPPNAKVVLHNWSLYDRPLQVAVEGGAPRPVDTKAVQVVDRSSEADVVITKRGGHLKLTRTTLYIVESTGTRTLPLPAITDPQRLQTILTRVAHFNYHLLRDSPQSLGSDVTVEMYRVQKDGGKCFKDDREPDNLLKDDTLSIRFREGALYGVLIKNKSQYPLYPNIFHFDPSNYSISPAYISSEIGSTPIPPHTGEFPIGYGTTTANPFEFSLVVGEEYDVGFLRIFLSTSNVRLEAIKRASMFDEAELRPIPNKDEIEVERHFKLHNPSAPKDLWDVRTIVVNVTRTMPSG